MKIFVAVSRRYARSIVEALSALKPKPYVLIASYDDDVEILSRSLGFEFVKIKDIEKLYTYEKLEDFDVAIAALDDDILNIACIRVAKSMGIPVTVSFLHNELNRDPLTREGVQSLLNLSSFIVGNIKFVLTSDTWIMVDLVSLARLVMALHKVVKRGVLGLDLKMLKGAIDFKDVNIFAIDSVGRFVDEDKALESGDTVVIVGAQDKVMKAIDSIEKVFKKYEQVYSIKYSDIHRFSGYG